VRVGLLLVDEVTPRNPQRQGAEVVPLVKGVGIPHREVVGKEQNLQNEGVTLHEEKTNSEMKDVTLRKHEDRIVCHLAEKLVRQTGRETRDLIGVCLGPLENRSLEKRPRNLRGAHHQGDRSAVGMTRIEAAGWFRKVMV
jgi:hypothetical protein